MNTLLWIAQGLTAAVFMYSGIHKSLNSEQKLVARGQTGVEGLSIYLIRFIGIMEILGAIGLVLPVWLGISPILTPVAAGLFIIIMVLAARIHYRRSEPKNVIGNIVLSLLCLFIVIGRIF